MKNLARILTLLLTVALIMGLASCSSKTKNGASSESASGSETGQATVKDRLIDLLAQAEAVTEEDKDSTAWATFQTAFAEAKAVMENAASTDEEYTAAYLSLSASLRALGVVIKSPGESAADNSAAGTPSKSQSGATKSSTVSVASQGPTRDNSGNIVTTPPAKYVKQAWETAAETQAKGKAASNATMDLSKTTYTITDQMFTAGYGGWGDIIQPDSLKYLKDIGVKDLRVDVDLLNICGSKLGEYNMEYKMPDGRDHGLGFVTRLKKMRAEGFTIIPVLSQGNVSLPSFFHGDLHDDDKVNPKMVGWWHYDRNGTNHYPNNGNQLDDMQTIAKEIATRMKSAGFGGLTWETMYEADGIQHNLVDTHHYAAKGLKQGDASIKIIGPATWPGYSVIDKFIKPYFAKYGQEALNHLDFVSMHWYAGNDFHSVPGMTGNQVMNMSKPDLLRRAMQVAPSYSQKVRETRAAIDSELGKLGSTKKIGIVFSEFDVNPQSITGIYVDNINFPNYYAASDCYVNANYYGGVWLASVMTDTFTNSPISMMMKFQTRHIWGYVDNETGTDNSYRMPVWYAVKLLRDGAGMKPGAKMVSSTVTGPMDGAASAYANKELYTEKKDTPWIQVTGVKNGSKTSIIVINRNSTALPVNLTVTGAGNKKMTRYVFSKDTTAPFIGAIFGMIGHGYFEGLDSTEKYTCIQAINYVDLASGKLNNYAAPGYSFTVFTF